MNPKLALVLGFLIGIAAGACGMFFARINTAPPAAAEPANATKQQVAEAAREKNTRGRMWWDMDAPTPEIGPTRSGSAGPAAPSSVTAVGSPVPGSSQDDWRNQSQEERQQRFMTFWSNQQVTARATFISNTVLSAQEVLKFDVVTEAMNVRLRARLDPIVAAYEKGWRPSPEERTRLALDVSAILVNTYDDLDRTMPDDWREGATNSYFSLTQFVEPKYMPFMRGMSGWGGGPGGPPPGFGGPPPAR
jgi:hypothetical protein